jgi:hypothetical protein
MSSLLEFVVIVVVVVRIGMGKVLRTWWFRDTWYGIAWHGMALKFNEAFQGRRSRHGEEIKKFAFPILQVYLGIC